MKVLCVAEKPSIAKSITGILSGGRHSVRNSPNKYIKNYDFDYELPPPLGPQRGGADFTVTAVLGHLTSSDFGEAHRQWQSCDPFVLFDAPIITQVSSDLRQVETNLKNEARSADLLMIWTDCDREGEHIGSEVAAVCKRANRNIRVKRARFSAIIAAQIHQACRQANDLDMRLADAVESRISLDLRVGAAFTRLMTMTLQVRIPQLAQQVISYGPCQFPTLGFVVDQYNRVQSFVPETFWYIYVAIEREDEDAPGETRTVEFKWKRNHLFDLEFAVVLYETCVERPLATVLKVETKPTTKWKPLPLTTVEMQQSGSRLLHMAPKKVLDLAEKLYQKGFLSYPRTETDQYDKAFDFTSLIQKQTHDNTWGQFAQNLLDGEYQRPRNGKKNDKAHPPIHPTNAANNLEGDEKRVYELVTRRFLASCSKNAEGKTTTVEAEIAGEFFSTSGLVITRRNYLDVYPYDKWTATAVPDFQEGEQFMPSVCELRDGTTSAPKLLTEADLVGLMDKNGIGTDATIAEHIARIIEREYVSERQEQKVKYLVPSPLGVGLVEGYNAIGFDQSLSKPHLRRDTERLMQLICEGAKTKQEVVTFSTEQYKELYVKARRDFNTVIDSVLNYLHGNGQEQEALRAAQRGRGGGRGGGRGRGGRGGGNAGGRTGGDGDDDGDDEGDDDWPEAGGGRGRGSGTRGKRGTSTRGTSKRGTSTRGGARGGRVVPESTTSRKRAADSPPNGNDDNIQCNCPNSAILRTAQTGANSGRQFWTCTKPQGDQCGFFQWADANANATAGPSRPRATTNGHGGSGSGPEPPTKRARTTVSDKPHRSAGSDGFMRCDCDLEAKHGQVFKDGPNKGRRFWACPNNPKAQCKFFQWIEDGEDPPSNSGPSRTNSRAGFGGGGGGGGSAGGSGGTSGECYKCGQPGHWASSCPNEDNRGGGGSRTNGAPRGGGGGGETTGECYKCGQQGHWASACTDDGGSGGPSRGGRGSTKTRGRGGSTRGGAKRGRGGSKGGGKSGGGGDECYKCGGTGHWASACQNAG